MSLILTNLYYKEKDIGLNLYKSKREFVWGFDLNGAPKHIKLEDSRLSNKKRVYKNGDLILLTKSKSNFSHDFELEGHHCTIIQYADKLELRIDNQSFTHLYNLQKNKELFNENGPTSQVNMAKQVKNNVSSKAYKKDIYNEPLYKNTYNSNQEDKPKLFSFKIKKNNKKKENGFKNKFQFGKEQSQNKNLNQTEYLNTENKEIDLLGFQNDNNYNNNTIDVEDDKVINYNNTINVDNIHDKNNNLFNDNNFKY